MASLSSSPFVGRTAGLSVAGRRGARVGGRAVGNRQQGRLVTKAFFNFGKKKEASGAATKTKKAPKAGEEEKEKEAPKKQAKPLTKLAIESGSYTITGTTRKRNEDRFQIELAESTSADPGEPWAFCGVYDGHGGYAASEWLVENLTDYFEKYWEPKFPELSLRTAYIKADAKLLAPKGAFGMGERGIGGSKCGATGVTVTVFKGDNGKQTLLTGNVGDARIVLARDGKPVQLSVDHTPDSDTEMRRIESKNPNKKMPLVRYQGGTWRVGGLLALSRAFGDAYLKGSLQFEGITDGGDGYSSGFGLIAEPYTTLQELQEGDSFLIVSSDGLYNEVERGGGGGLTNEQAVEMAISLSKKGMSLDEIAKKMTERAIKQGSTDDITCCLLKLNY